MNFHVFAPKYPISAQFGYYFSRQTDSGAGIACFCHSLVMSLLLMRSVVPPNNVVHHNNTKKGGNCLNSANKGATINIKYFCHCLLCVAL